MLEAIGSILIAMPRSYDVSARYGGEESVALRPATAARSPSRCRPGSRCRWPSRCVVLTGEARLAEPA